MKRLFKPIAALLGALVLASLLPWLANLCFPSQVYDPFVSWSPITDSFIVSYNNAEGEEPLIFDQHHPDQTFTVEQRDSLLPEIYTNQLMQRRAMPDSIKGQPVTMMDLRRNRWVFSSSPRDINRSIPAIYPLMESMPLRFDLQDPDHAFRATGDGIEIIEIASSSIDATKTRRFNDMLRKRGFEFPVQYAGANITARKGYDNGYLLIDNSGAVYHMKMQAGRPSVARIGRPGDHAATHAWVMENMDRREYGLVATDDNRLWAINHDDYALRELPVGEFQPTKDKLMVVKNLFSWVVKISNDSTSTWSALDPDTFELMGEYAPARGENRTEAITSWIFPFTITWTSPCDQWVYPRFKSFSERALILNALLSLLMLCWARRCKDNGREALSKSLATMLLGIYMFIPLFFLTKHQ